VLTRRRVPTLTAGIWPSRIIRRRVGVEHPIVWAALGIEMSFCIMFFGLSRLCFKIICSYLFLFDHIGVVHLSKRQAVGFGWKSFCVDIILTVKDFHVIIKIT
jgi:hypothetical protein